MANTNSLVKVSTVSNVNSSNLGGSDLFYYIYQAPGGPISTTLKLSDLFIGTNNLTSDIKFNTNTLYIKSGKVGINKTPSVALDVLGSSVVSSNITIGGIANISGTTILGSSLSVVSTIIAGGNITSSTGNISAIVGSGTFGGNITGGGSLVITGSITGHSSLGITGPITGNSTLLITGTITGNSTLGVGGNITGGGTITVPGNISSTSGSISAGTTGTFGTSISAGTTGSFGGQITMLSRLVDAFPAGTCIVFAQSTAPTGWTKVTTYNDAALRVVSGTASSGGTVNFSSAFSTFTISGTVDGHAITSSEMPSHTHVLTDPGHIHSYKYGRAAGRQTGSITVADTIDNSDLQSTTPSSTGITIANTGNGTTHSHTFTANTSSLIVKYVDTILCTKN